MEPIVAVFPNSQTPKWISWPSSSKALAIPQGCTYFISSGAGRRMLGNSSRQRVFRSPTCPRTWPVSKIADSLSLGPRDGPPTTRLRTRESKISFLPRRTSSDVSPAGFATAIGTSHELSQFLESCSLDRGAGLGKHHGRRMRGQHHLGRTRDYGFCGDQWPLDHRPAHRGIALAFSSQRR